MPPKKAAKETPTKAAATKGSAKNTPKKDTPKKATPKKEKEKEVPKTPTPKKPKEVAKYESLAQDKNATLPISVTFAGGNVQAKQVKSTYQHSLKLEAAAAFSLVKTYTINEGEHEGHQVILIKPAKAFAFLKLPVEIRRRVYEIHFYPKGVAGDPITLDGKRKNETKDPFAKTYSEGKKNRVALLAVNKEINEEATPVFYSNLLRFDTPATLMTFFAGLDSHLRVHLRHIEIRMYVKKDAKNALAFLAEAKNLEHLRIELGVASEDDASKAARSFWLDACKLLEAVGANFEKKMVPARKAKLFVKEEEKAVEESDEESGEEDEDEDEEEEGEEDGADEDGAESGENGKTDEAASSDKQASAGSDAGSEGEAMAVDEKKDTAATKSADPKKASPTVAATPTKPAPPQPPQLIQGEKCFAVDILHFGRNAFKNKDGSVWTNNKKQVFLDVLEAKLNLAHLSFWTCICGTNVNGHSCTAELQDRREKLAQTSRVREQFEHLGHGGAEMIIAAYDRGSAS